LHETEVMPVAGLIPPLGLQGREVGRMVRRTLFYSFARSTLTGNVGAPTEALPLTGGVVLQRPLAKGVRLSL
jgi:hypothetical protein